MLLAVTVAYVAGILALTVVPNWHIFRDTITGEIFFSSGISERQTPNLIPFRTILAYLREQVSVNDREIPGHIVMYLGGNLLAFVPLGFLFERLMPKLPVFQVAVGFPFAIETIQYFIGRNADIDDLLLNACGITLGWLFSKVPDRIKGE